MHSDIESVFVTGGAGCIGLQVCRAALDRGLTVHLFDLPEQLGRVTQAIPEGVEVHSGSILDCSSLRDAMMGCDAVVHLAAYLGVRRTETNRLRCLEINVNGTQNVLECAIQNRVKKFVFASSSEVYGEPQSNPITESSVTQGKTVYAVSKLVGEELCKAYTQRYPDFAITVLRYFNTYGPYQTAQFVIPKFIKSVQDNKPPVIYGDGNQVRSYCYAGDTARATIAALLNSAANGETINIGNSQKPVSLVELADLVIRVCGKEMSLEPEYCNDFTRTDRSREREIFSRYCSMSKANRLLEFAPQVSLEDGIALVLQSDTLFSKWESPDMQYTLDDWI